MGTMFLSPGRRDHSRAAALFGELQLMSHSRTNQTQPRASSALATSPIHNLRRLKVEARDNQLRIHGLVTSYYHKQMAQEAVLAVADGMQVVNTIAVVNRPGDLDD